MCVQGRAVEQPIDVVTENTVTVNSTGTGAAGGGNFAQGATVSINAGTAPAGQQFSHWTASPTVTFANANNANTTFTMIGEAVTVTANFVPLPTVPLPTITLNPTGTTINNTNLSRIINVGGTATGAITVSGLPTGITSTVSDNTVTLTGIRPTAQGASPITGTHSITITRGDVSQTLSLTINLTTTWTPPQGYSPLKPKSQASLQ